MLQLFVVTVLAIAGLKRP